jgi:histidinol-phosphate aminotransferase
MTTLNRRNWLKASFGLASGMALSPLLIDRLSAAPMNRFEESYFGALPPTIKVRLNSNENPYGPSEKAKQAVIQILNEGNRYPFAVAAELKELIAKKEGITADHIALGAGSGEMLCCSGAAFGLEGGSILSPYPTFPLLMAYGEVVNARWDKVDLNEKLEVNYEGLASNIKSDTKLVFVCNPNNPTGTLVDGNFVTNFCEEVSKKVPVFADEAYLEFLEPSQQRSAVDLVKKGHNVIVSKTFSKIYGLAGLRVGYIIAKPDLIKKVTRYQSGFSTSQTAIAAAKASLGDEGFMTMSRMKNAEARKVLTDYLDKRGYFYGKSVTNFVFFDPKKDGQSILNKLAEREIGIRVWEYQGKMWNRISVGTKEEMKTLVKNLDEIML